MAGLGRARSQAGRQDLRPVSASCRLSPLDWPEPRDRGTLLTIDGSAAESFCAAIALRNATARTSDHWSRPISPFLTSRPPANIRPPSKHGASTPGKPDKPGA